MTGGLVKVAYDEFQGTSQTYYIGVGGMFGIFSALTGVGLPWRLKLALHMLPSIGICIC